MINQKDLEKTYLTTVCDILENKEGVKDMQKLLREASDAYRKNDFSKFMEIRRQLIKRKMI